MPPLPAAAAPPPPPGPPPASASPSDASSLTVFVGTWNVGNAPPSMAACSDWLARCRGHDIVAIAAQEASYPHSKRNLSPASVSERLGAAGSESGSRETYRVERLGASTLGWLRSSKLARAAGAVAGAAAGAVTSGPFAPVGAVVGAVAGYYSSLAAAREAKVRTHWNDLVKAAAGPGYVVVQSVAFVQMRLVVLARDAIVHRVREVRVGHQATGVFNAIGNKGGMMVRVRFGDPGLGSIAFVAAHLAAHEGAKHVSARNDDLARILRGCWESSAVRDIGEPPGDRANAVTVIRREGRRESRREIREGDEKGDEGRGLSEEGDERRVFSEEDRRGRGSGYTGSSNTPGPLEATAPPLLASLVTAASATAASLSAALDEATERAAETVRGAKEKSGFDQRKKGKTTDAAASSSLRNRRKRLGPPPPPLELLACTSHVFVFGDLNYRVDPGAASGRGWGSMWKRPGSDAPSGSIAAYAAGLASKRAKKRREKKARAEFVAERRHREAAEEAREKRDDEEEEEEEEEEDQNNAREDRPKRADSTRARKEKAAIARWVAGWHFVADAVDAAFGERTRGARAPLDDEGATPNNSAPDPPPAAASLARILAGDQLARERRIGTALHGFREAEIAFPPTFKFEVPSRERNAREGGGVSDDAAGGGDANAAEKEREKEKEKKEARSQKSRRRYDEKRVPSWCDRVLVWSRPGAAPATARAYESVESVTTSDHAPVFASYRVTARRREGGGEGEGGGGGGGLALGGGEGGGLAGALAGLSVSDAASDFGSMSSTSSAFPRVRIRVASLRATLEDVDPLGPRGRDPDPDPDPDAIADGAGARETDSARRQKPQNPQNPQKPQTKPAGALAALDASAAVAASIGASAPVSITVAEALRRLRGERGGGEPSGEPSATDPPPGGAAAETNPNPPRSSTDVRPTFGGGPSGSSHPPATCAAHFAVPGGSVVDPLAPPPGAQSRAVVIARRKPTREGSEAEAALRGAEESTEESPTEPSADAAEITWAPADLPAFALDLRPAPRRGAESRRSRRGGRRSAGGSLLEGGDPFEGGFETPDPASAFGAARARTASERRATEVKSDANANANAEKHTPAGNRPSLSSPRRRGEEKGPFDPSGDEETPAFESAPRLGAGALRASVAASSLGDEALVVTLALDRDALGCATVPLTRLARRFADAAAEAENAGAGAGAAAPRGLRASAHFAAPLVSFGRLRGRVEGALEMSAWTSEDDER